MQIPIPARNTAMRIFTASLAGVLLCVSGGCPRKIDDAPAKIPTGPVVLQGVNLTDVANPAPNNQPIFLSAASNEWMNFTLQVGVPASQGYWLRLRPLHGAHGGMIEPASFQPFQVLAMPVDMDRAGYVRHSGQVARRKNIPRALLPQILDNDGTVNLSSLRNPNQPTDPRSHAGGPGADPAMLWFDLHVPSGTSAGLYSGSIDLMQAGVPRPLATLPINVTVYDFELPDMRHLQMVGRLGWDRLEKLYPSQFETFTPMLVNRREGRYQATVRTLDHLVSLAQANRSTLVVPALKPVVKWPAGEGPQVDWQDFDSMLQPWLGGDAFADHVGLQYWPLPEAEMLSRYDKDSRLAYWSAATAHFSEKRWLNLTAISLENPNGGRADATEAASLSAEAADILSKTPDVRVLLPLEDDQVQIAGTTNPAGIDPTGAGRLLTSSAALVSTAKPFPWANAIPRHWLRTDLPGLVPYIGAGGDERDVRVWAWLAFLRHLDRVGVRNVYEQNYILWNSTLPLASRPDVPADPGELVWFYPGEWFGVDLPVATIQLKWLRRAQQDYEYLLMAQERGEAINALQLARLITKPVELQQGQMPDPAYALLTGTTNQQAWTDTEKLLADTIMLRKPGSPVDPTRQEEVYLRTLQLSAPQERRMLMGRSAKWSWNDTPPDAAQPGTWVDLDFDIDIYNASETTPNKNHLRWARVPAGWEIKPQEQEVAQLETYHVQRATLPLKFNLDHAVPASREPMELQFIDGFTQTASLLKVVLPVAICDKREGELLIDGVLDDWSTQDLIQDGPLVRMFNRPALQRQELQRASSETRVYSSWGRDNLYLAFSLDGIVPKPEQAKNFVDYQQRRAWGEDLCEILIQPIFPNNKVGPVLHIVCKPNGGVWLERKPDTRPGDGGWKGLDSSAIRYFAKTPDSSATWQGEMAIPWSAIMDKAREAPSLMRFNFAQHKAATGESATWAGPVDYGRDETMMGLLYLRSPGQNGARTLVQTERSSSENR